MEIPPTGPSFHVKDHEEREMVCGPHLYDHARESRQSGGYGHEGVTCT